jgi:hypothetical protein
MHTPYEHHTERTDDEPPIEPNAAGTPAEHGKRPPFRLGLPLGIVAFGLALLWVAAAWDAAWLEEGIWTRALWTPEPIEGLEPPEEHRPVRARRLPLANLPTVEMVVQEFDRQGVDDEGRTVNDLFGLDDTEWILHLSLEEGEAEALLASGRLPEPGSREVLAGKLARLTTFTLDGETWEAVGRIDGRAAGLQFAYLLPAGDETPAPFLPRNGASEGWFLEDGMEWLRGVEQPDGLALNLRESVVRSSRQLSPGGVAFLTWLGLLAVAVGGAWAQVRLLAGLFARIPGLGFAHQALAARWPVLTVHVLLYATLFGALAIGSLVPIITIYLGNMIIHMFSEGDLAYVGQAYESGNVILAAVATWRNNYLVQTLLLTLLPSVVPILGALFAVGKTALSLVIVGLAMAPVWAGNAIAMTYHSITLTLEIEAYVLACYLGLWYGICLVRAPLEDARASHLLKQGGLTLLLAVVLTGVLLAVAGAYEALTLILLAPLLG